MSYRGGSVRPSGLGPTRGKLRLLSRRLAGGLRAAQFSWSGAGCQRAHTSPLPPDSGFLIFVLTCAEAVISLFYQEGGGGSSYDPRATHIPLHAGGIPNVLEEGLCAKTPVRLSGRDDSIMKNKPRNL